MAAKQPDFAKKCLQFVHFAEKLCPESELGEGV